MKYSRDLANWFHHLYLQVIIMLCIFLYNTLMEFSKPSPWGLNQRATIYMPIYIDYNYIWTLVLGSRLS